MSNAAARIPNAEILPPPPDRIAAQALAALRVATEQAYQAARLVDAYHRGYAETVPTAGVFELLVELAEVAELKEAYAKAHQSCDWEGRSPESRETWKRLFDRHERIVRDLANAGRVLRQERAA